MKINIKLSKFEQELNSFKKEFELLAKENISNEEEFSGIEQSLNQIKGKCAKYIESTFSKDIGIQFSNLIRYENRFNLGMKLPLNQKGKILIDRIKDRTRTIQYIIQIVKLSDPLSLGRSFVKERSNLSTNEKVTFLLSKLYALRKTNQLWDTKMIFEFNQIELDSYDEPRGITEILENNGFAETIGTKDGLSAKITTEGKLYWEENSKSINTKDKKMKIFISHSHKDVDLAKALIELIRNALNLKAEDIRCTSVDGYRLKAGASTDDQLKAEIHECEVLIGLISPSSISSYYVLFELGARWGANKPLIPLITNEQGGDLLKGPLKGINALNTNSESQLFQLIGDLSETLNVSPEKANAYQAYINKLSSLSKSDTGSVESITSPKQDAVLNNLDYSDADEKIKKYCKNYWKDDYSMQVSCIQEHREAVEKLKEGKPDDISDNDFVLIRKKAAEYWEDDYTMRLSQEREQFDAIRKLRDM